VIWGKGSTTAPEVYRGARSIEIPWIRALPSPQAARPNSHSTNPDVGPEPLVSQAPAPIEPEDAWTLAGKARRLSAGQPQRVEVAPRLSDREPDEVAAASFNSGGSCREQSTSANRRPQMDCRV
jgi:hypothetical protein